MSSKATSSEVKGIPPLSLEPGELNQAVAAPEQARAEGTMSPLRSIPLERLPWESLTPEQALKALRETYTPQEKEDALKKTTRIVKEYSEEMVERWNREIDTLLVYAGLFSAILTAFNVQSYPLLQPAPPDPTLAVLQQISMQLNNFSLNPPFVNVTQPALPFPEGSLPGPKASSWVIALNILWFSGLICSLAAASVGIMVKQWLNEYNAALSGDSLEIARLRQYRLNNLIKWRVTEIVAFLPVLLQSSLVLFLSGLLVLLWNLHRTVAIVATLLVGLVLAFMICTAVLPVFYLGCCYLSALTYVGFYAVERLWHAFNAVSCVANDFGHRAFTHLRSHTHSPFLRGFSSRLADFFCRQGQTSGSWPTPRGEEQAKVQSELSLLDSDMTAMAYAINMDTAYLGIAAIHLTGLDSSAAAKCLDRMEAIDERHYGKYSHQRAKLRPSSFWMTAFIHGINSNARPRDLVAAINHINRASVYGWVSVSGRDTSWAPRLLLAVLAAKEERKRIIWVFPLWKIQHADLSILSWKAARQGESALSLTIPHQLIYTLPSPLSFDHSRAEVVPALEEWFYEMLVDQHPDHWKELTVFRLLICCYTATLDPAHRWAAEATEKEKEALLKCSERAVGALMRSWAAPPPEEGYQKYPTNRLASTLHMLCQPPHDGSLITAEFVAAVERLAVGERVRSESSRNAARQSMYADEISPLEKAIEECKNICRVKGRDKPSRSESGSIFTKS